MANSHSFLSGIPSCPSEKCLLYNTALMWSHSMTSHCFKSELYLRQSLGRAWELVDLHHKHLLQKICRAHILLGLSRHCYSNSAGTALQYRMTSTQPAKKGNASLHCYFLFVALWLSHCIRNKRKIQYLISAGILGGIFLLYLAEISPVWCHHCTHFDTNSVMYINYRSIFSCSRGKIYEQIALWWLLLIKVHLLNIMYMFLGQRWLIERLSGHCWEWSMFLTTL